MRPWVVLVAVGLAGCLAPEDGSAPSDPERWPGGAWTATEAPLWVAASGGCGHCSGSTNHPEFGATGYYRDGSVLTIDYGTGPEHVQFVAGVDPEIREEVMEFFALHDAYAEYRADRGDVDIRVHEVHARRLAGPEAVDAELRVLLNATGQPKDTGHRVMDCGSPIVEVWPAPGRVAFGCQRTNEGWDAVSDMMYDLGQWARGADPAT